jgi:hypothetical protein
MISVWLRYDSRLYLTSLDEFDNPIRSKSNPDETEQEQLEEELCDEERYRELVYPAEYDEAHTSNIYLFIFMFTR